MNVQYQSNTDLINVNKALKDALRSYVDGAVDIRFDLPDPADPPSVPVVSVFLYDLCEDLEMRMGESRSYNKSNGHLLPGKVNVCCNYLITYWDSTQASSDGGPSGAPNNQSMLVMNQVLNGLVNNRQLKGVPGAYTRVIPPKDQGLYSLGSFWQSLGNKPRLLLNYAVTFGLTLTDHADVITPLSMTEIVLEQQSTPGP